MRICQIGCQIWQGIRLYDENYENLLIILGENSIQRINILGFIFIDPGTTIASGVVITGLVCVICTAYLPVGSLCMTISVWKVINDENDELVAFGYSIL